MIKKVETHEKTARIVSPSLTFQIIHEIVKQSRFKHLISYLCDSCGVSRSGYYRYFSSCAKAARLKRQQEEETRLAAIKQAINFKNRTTKGIRQVAMVLQGEFNLTYNLKSVHRIMRKYHLLSPVRRANPYRKIPKATHEHRIYSNKVNCEFKRSKPNKVFLTDITYLKYGKNRTAYLSTIIDSATNEVVASQISENLKIDFVLQTLDKLRENPNIQLTEISMIHSDQGVHYSSPQFSTKLKELGIQQSMSRRGNCWDNTPQESFFGHLKDEANIKQQQTFEELAEEIYDYIYYYNHYRYQWNLKKLTPVKFRNQLLAA